MNRLITLILLGWGMISTSANAAPLTYRMILTGEGYNELTGLTETFSAIGTFVWDRNNTVDFNEYCRAECSEIPELALVSGFNLSIPELDVFVDGSDDEFGFFNSEFGYIAFDGESLSGFCLTEYAEIRVGCVQANTGFFSDEYSRETFVYDNSDAFGWAFYLFSNNSWQWAYDNQGDFRGQIFGTVDFQPVPLPAAFWLFLAGMGGLCATQKRRLNIH
ncbi:VPLPA-CTERM sorting domain-containing protein [Hyphococcus sp.]|uniref:VPLPA-CTERM sorting domain-containing protein n=1 Tax=Hyphococcus sp. TaxID=2038636 RepID=UPI0035C6D051